MRRALVSLKEKQNQTPKIYTAKTLNNEFDIQTTDYYVKFWIENDEHRNLLLADSLNLSIIPMDVEIEQEGDYYVDENTEIEQAIWLYSSVKHDYEFNPEVVYEKIEDLFLPEPSEPEGIDGEDDDGQGATTTIVGKSGISKSFLFDLEDEALKITGNWEKPEEADNEGFEAKRSKRRPQGYIKVINTTNGKPDPVVGVKVKTRRWFKWAKGYTNSQGYYKVNRGYRRDVNYTVVFKNTRGFKIWPSTISVSSARYRAGKKSKYGHSITFGNNSAGWRWATVNNATVKYLDYCTQFGIGKPHSNLRIVARNGTGPSSAPMLRRVWGFIGFTTNSQLVTFLSKANSISLGANFIAIVTKFVQPDVIIQAASSRGTAKVTEVTFHELAHASHYRVVGNSYWVKYINYIITYGAYGDGTGNNSGVCAVGEMWAYYFGYFLTLQEFGNNNSNPLIRPMALEDFRLFKDQIAEILIDLTIQYLEWRDGFLSVLYTI